MERLTDKNALDFLRKLPKTFNFSHDDLRYLKLGDYENADEKLGISFLIALKALDNGIWCKENEFEEEYHLYKVRGLEKTGLSVISRVCGYAECDFTKLYKDLNKTWFLNKEDIPLN